MRHLRPKLDTAGLRITPLGDDSVEITLTFPGLEVSEETCDRLFEPFSGPKEGSDPPLGLAGVVRPWQSVGGTITFEAEPGEAPRLVLTCPAAGDEADATPFTVLVVEDEPGIRSLVVKALERQGYHVIQASTAEEAFHACEAVEANIDLLITDLTMPGQTGRQLAEYVRTKWPDTRVLFISGFTDDEQLAAQIGAGKLPERTRFLAKPFQVAQLIVEVKALLAG
ncbi:MAG: response regulator [Paludibaculum sp.]